ncbi:MAG: biopolymer transporter ExbD [Lentisphaerae bacterium]|nr:biopolymer transporter ExbD [Lentisphaerota bacterium]
MSRRTTIVALSEIKEINLTPLIDLTFLLLITFIITFPLIEQGIPVNLPRGKAQDLPERQTRTVTIDPKGALFLDKQPIGREAFTEEMNALGAADPDVTIMVRADEGVAYGKVAEILRILHGAKIARLALVHQTDTPK